jgi:predicted ArsR family transcriptional regulator
LLDAFNHLNHESFTAQQLADAYGVQPRSARRFLAALSSAGFAEVTGVWTRPSAGRPQTFYRIDMKGLIKSLGSTSEIGSNDQHPDAADSATKNQ